MSLTARKDRPLHRDTAEFRDDRLFLIASDDTYAPKQYFDALRIPRVKFFVVPTEDGTSVAEQVLRRLLAYNCFPDDERWLVLDTDHCAQGTHLGAFVSALQDAEQKGIKIALSKPCFELWLLLHFVDCEDVESLERCADVEGKLRELLDGYNKRNIRPERFLPHQQLACERTGKLDEKVSGGRIPTGNTSRVYRIFSAIQQKGFASRGF